MRMAANVAATEEGSLPSTGHRKCHLCEGPSNHGPANLGAASRRECVNPEPVRKCSHHHLRVRRDRVGRGRALHRRRRRRLGQDGGLGRDLRRRPQLHFEFFSLGLSLRGFVPQPRLQFIDLPLHAEGAFSECCFHGVPSLFDLFAVSVGACFSDVAVHPGLLEGLFSDPQQVLEVFELPPELLRVRLELLLTRLRRKELLLPLLHTVHLVCV
mmetsp:Transcript_106210/g.269815  ORF Transcript_106210/g.269815 Transcript_106210/m.269815 type:complete len:213 (-) Transcript_106210:197-835(-)